ncbi:hypothetical protein [Altererythrobacter sp. MTPC7]|uniref:hypothetical protein n=1 Tax=Altererythrobacter sp. MTPC7 TaxID=3056567 RepID=UPI0036F42506
MAVTALLALCCLLFEIHHIWSFNEPANLTLRVVFWLGAIIALTMRIVRLQWWLPVATLMTAYAIIWFISDAIFVEAGFLAHAVLWLLIALTGWYSRKTQQP